MRVRSTTCLLILLASIAMPATATTQELPVRPGDRVRLQSRELPRIVGTVMPGPRDTITVAVRAPGARPDSAGAVRFVHVPLAAAQGIQVSRGRSHLSGAWPGFVTGLFLGAAFSGAMLQEVQNNPGEGAEIGIFMALVAPPLVSVAGGVVGFLLGREHWETVIR